MNPIVFAASAMLFLQGCQSTTPPDAPDAYPVIPPDSSDEEPTVVVKKLSLEATRAPASEGEKTPGLSLAPLAKVHFLPIGAGSCQVLECVGEGPILFDCGSSGGGRQMNDNALAEYVQDILDRSGHPPRVVISHPDADHLSLVLTALGNNQPSSVWLGGCEPGKGGCYEETKLKPWLDGLDDSVAIHDTFKKGFHNAGAPVPELSCGLAQSYILTVGSGSSDNSRSLVVAVAVGSVSFVFTGDAEGTTETDAAKNIPPALGTIEFLTSSHHGATTHDSNGNAWANATQPSAVISTAGTKYGHPRCDAISTYEEHLAPAEPHKMQCGYREDRKTKYRESERSLATYSTHSSGAIIVTVTSDGNTSVECEHDPSCNILAANAQRVNVNTANQSTLESLPQIGPTRATAIIEYRKNNGPFRNLEDLDKVSGIGPATLEAIKELVEF